MTPEMSAWEPEHERIGKGIALGAVLGAALWLVILATIAAVVWMP